MILTCAGRCIYKTSLEAGFESGFEIESFGSSSDGDDESWWRYVPVVIK